MHAIALFVLLETPSAFVLSKPRDEIQIILYRERKEHKEEVEGSFRKKKAEEQEEKKRNGKSKRRRTEERHRRSDGVEK